MDSARKILVVEDEDDVREFISSILRSGNYAVVEAASLAEARVALASERFDVVVSDIGLPDGDGLDLLPHVASISPATRFVVCTGDATWDRAVRALRSGAYDFLAKPVNKDALRSTVRRAVEARFLEEQNEVLVSRLAERVSALKKMLEVTSEVSGSIDLPVVLSLAVDRTLAFMNAPAGSILLREEDDALRFAVVRGGSEALAGARLPPGTGVAGWVMAHSRTLVINDTSGDRRFSNEMDRAIGSHTRSVLACPLKAKGRVIGVLEVINVEGRFTREHKLAAETLSYPIAAAIENARITQNLHRSQALLVEQSAMLERKVWERTTELRASNESLATANKRLEETRDQMVRAEKMASVGTIAAGVAHEINNPIGFINSNLQTLRGYIGELKPLIEDYRRISPPDPAIEARVKRMDLDYVLADLEILVRESEDGVNRVVKIVKDLKTFSHADRSAPEEADLNACIEAAVNLSRNETRYVADVVVELGNLPKVRSWPGQITQVLVNLIVNAAHAIGTEPDRQGTIKVRTVVDGESVILEVADDGCGIPPAIASRIFDPFFTTKEPGRGTGLGLSLSYEIVERHRGTISFAAGPGRGTTFQVRIPVLGPDAEVQEHPAGTRKSRNREDGNSLALVEH